MTAKKKTDNGEDKPIVRPKASDLWTYYRVEWNFLTRLCGQVPAAPELIEAWINARKPSVRPAGGRSIQELQEEAIATLERGEEEPTYSMLVFQRVSGACCMRAGTVKAHMKDCARQISSLYVPRIAREKSFAVRVVNGVYPDEHQYWLPIMRNGQLVAEPDGAFDKAARAETPQGRVTFLKRIEYIDQPTLTFTMKVLGKAVSEEDLHILFTYGGTHGYAGERGDGEGRYEYTLERIEPPTKEVTDGQ